MGTLQIRLLGELRATTSSGAEIRFPTRKAQALFAFLASPPGRARTRETLAALLWSRNAEDQARSNLRQNLSRLRKALGTAGQALVADSQEIALDPDLVSTDVTVFEHSALSQNPDAWIEAARLLNGEFAAGHNIAEPGYDDWIATERRRVADLAVGLLTRLIDHYEANNDFGMVGETAKKLLLFDAVDESAHKALMRSLAEQERFEAALQQYKLFRDILRKELDIDPSDEVRRLHDEIARRRAAARHVPNAPAVETDDLVASLNHAKSEDSPPKAGLPPQLHGLALYPPERPSIVILPFSNLTGEAEQEYLAEGIRIDVQAALVKITGIFLIAAGSANAVRGQDAQTAGNQLGVRYVLQGSVRRAGQKLRISAELIDVTNGEAIWTETYDRQLDDEFSVQDEIVASIIRELDVKLLRGEDAAVWHKTLKNRSALESFYKGVHEFFKLQKDSMLRARLAFEAVDRIQPDVSTGATWVALCHWFDAFKGWRGERDVCLENAEAWSKKAVAMDDPDGQAHMVLSHVHLMKRRFDEALIVGREAIQLRPNCTNANGFFANVLHFCGEQQDAIEHVCWAIRYSPVYPPFFADILSLALLFDGASETAITVARKALSLNPASQIARLVLIAGNWEIGEFAEARQISERLIQSDPGFSLSRFKALQPYRNPDDLDDFIQKLKSAGLPA